MAVKRLFNDRHYFPDSSGNNALSGGKLFIYLAGSATKATTYNSSTGLVANSNPLVLDAAGKLQSEVWLTTGATYKLFLTVSTDTDPPVGTNLCPEDNISGINDFPATTITGEWIVSGYVPTYVSASSFTIPTNLTAILQVGRRLRIVDAGGTKYATITASSFGAGVTTVTVLVDSAGSLANPVSTVDYGLVSSVNTSIPFFVVQNIYPPSSVPNAFFQVDQLANSATSVADDVYGHDHWYVLTQTAAIQVSSQTLQENGQSTNARLTQNQVASQRMGYACIIEAKEAQKLRGQTMTFQPRVRCSASQAIRIAVVEWTGTADAVTSDIVNDWTSADYTDGAGKFFVDANQAPLGNSAVTPVVATWTDATSLPVTIGSSCNNLIVFVWTEQVAAQNVTLDIGKVRFVRGTFASDLYIPTFDETLRYAQRFALSYKGTAGNEYICMGQAFSTTQIRALFPLSVPSRVPFTGITFGSAAGDFSITGSGGGGTACSAIVISAGLPPSTTCAGIQATIGAATLVAGNASYLFSSNANARMDFTGARL